MSLGPRVYRYVPVVVVLKLKSQLFTWILKSKLKVCTSEIVDTLSAVQKNAVFWTDKTRMCLVYRYEYGRLL
jgi:hypothetical protein